MRRRRGSRTGIALLCFAPLLVGCFGSVKVARVYDGRLVEGAFVPPDAYAQFLEGVLAEEAGQLEGALSAYERAAREDDEDPEPLARIGELRCRVNPKDARADDALTRALRLDPTYTPALAAQARCAAKRGSPDRAAEILARVATADRSDASLEALLVRVVAARADSDADRATRRRAIALTIASGERPVVWDALVAWGRGKSEPELLARGLEGLLRVAPTRSAEIETGALELLGLGETSLARKVAAAVADAPASVGITTVRDATVARLAVDEALVSGEIERAERRATRGRVPLAEVAARALLLERPDIAREVARRVLAADPRAGCGAMVLAAIAARAGTPPSVEELFRSSAPPSDSPALACVLAVAERLVAFGDVATARAWTARVAPAPMSAHDPVTGPLAVDLAASGVVDESALPLELRLELAARRGEAPPALDAAAIAKKIVDAKHALLWHMLTDPAATPAKALLGRMARAADRDPIVGFSLVRASLATAPASSGAAPWTPVVRAIAASPAHPLLLAAAVEVAKRGGRAEDVPPAKARLFAVARTPAERALAAE